MSIMNHTACDHSTKMSAFCCQYLIDNAKWLFEGGSDADDDDDGDEEGENRAAKAGGEEDHSDDSDDVEVNKINSGRGEEKLHITHIVTISYKDLSYVLSMSHAMQNIFATVERECCLALWRD